MDIDRHVERAAAAISAVLEDLEKTTGQRVASIDLVDVDITRVSDTMRRVATSVVIRLESPTQRTWA